MSKIPIVNFLILMIAISSCKPNRETKISDEEKWKLGWRIIESSMDENLKQAESQFDSLLSITNNLDTKFLVNGLEVKLKLNKEEEAMEIMNRQRIEMRQQLCFNDELSRLDLCKEFLEEKVENKELQIELIRMYINDQACRGNMMNDIISKYSVPKDQISQDGCITIDKRNRSRLKEIFSEIGFPTRKMIGKDAMYGTFLMLQHSDRDKEWQKSQLPNIEKAVKRGDLQGQSYAYLYDRIARNEGKNQLYGTQFELVDKKENVYKLAPTDDSKNLENRRRKIGLMPISMYKKLHAKYNGVQVK